VARQNPKPPTDHPKPQTAFFKLSNREFNSMNEGKSGALTMMYTVQDGNRIYVGTFDGMWAFKRY
jgi:hypothetical protein